MEVSPTDILITSLSEFHHLHSYTLQFLFPVLVDADQSVAKFNKKTAVLTITLPVVGKRTMPENEEILINQLNLNEMKNNNSTNTATTAAAVNNETDVTNAAKLAASVSVSGTATASATASSQASSAPQTATTESKQVVDWKAKLQLSNPYIAQLCD